MESPLPDLMIQTRGKFQVYRNIPTCSPSQNFFDDLVEDDDWSVLQYVDNFSSGIDHKAPTKTALSDQHISRLKSSALNKNKSMLGVAL